MSEYMLGVISGGLVTTVVSIAIALFLALKQKLSDPFSDK